MNHKEVLYKLGFQQGVYDSDDNLPKLELDEDYGNLYIKGYNKGYQEAKTKSWYIACTGPTNMIVGFMSEDGWVIIKQDAIKFKTRQLAVKRHKRLVNSCGNYKVVWE